jgi:hypothetical protein
MSDPPPPLVAECTVERLAGRWPLSSPCEGPAPGLRFPMADRSALGMVQIEMSDEGEIELAADALEITAREEARQ